MPAKIGKFTKIEKTSARFHRPRSVLCLTSWTIEQITSQQQQNNHQSIMKPIPDNVADILNQLSGPHQVALRSYIATLRAEIRQFEEDLHAKEDADPHAHYHGALVYSLRFWQWVY
jgi:hypothetical protein